MQRLTGLILIIISAVTFGTLGILGRYAYAAGMDTFTILFLRFSLSAVVMAGWLGMRRAALPRGGLLWKLVGMGAVGYVGQSFCYFTALQYASPGLVALLLYLYPVLVALLAVIFLRTRLASPEIWALALALAGTALTVGPAGGQLLGVALGLGAALIYSVYILVGTHVLRQVSAMVSSTVIFASAALVYGLAAWLKGPALPQDPSGWWAMAGIVVFGTITPVVTFLAGLERVGPTTASTLSTLEPVVTVALAAWLFGERLPPVTLVGGVLILGAVALLARSEARRSNLPVQPEKQAQTG